MTVHQIEAVTLLLAGEQDVAEIIEKISSTGWPLVTCFLDDRSIVRIYSDGQQRRYGTMDPWYELFYKETKGAENDW